MHSSTVFRAPDFVRAERSWWLTVLIDTPRSSATTGRQSDDGPLSLGQTVQPFRVLHRTGHPTQTHDR